MGLMSKYPRATIVSKSINEVWYSCVTLLTELSPLFCSPQRYKKIKGAEQKQDAWDTQKKYETVWEKKNTKAARAGGVSLIALSLAACGSDDATTTTTTSTSTSTTTTPVGLSLTATTGIDVLNGGAGDDTITADLINEAGVANVTTLGSMDTVDGGAGADSMTAVYDDATAPTISNVETITLSTRAAVAFDAVNTTGVTTLNLSASSNASDINNLGTIPTVNVSNSTAGIDLDFTATAVAGTADTLNLTVASVTAGTFTIDAGIETIAIASNGAVANTIADLTTGAAGASELTLSGATGLTITASLDAAVTTIDGSAMTGAMTVTQDAAANITVTGGSDNDFIDLGGDNFDGSDTVNGGAGTDTLSIEEDDAIALTTAAVELTKISNIEIINLTDTLAGNVTLSFFGAASTLELSAGIDATDRTLTLVSGDTIDLEADAGDDITIVASGSGTSDIVNLILNNADIAANIQAATLETLNITTTGTADAGVNTITGTTAINAIAGTQSIVINGGEALTFTGAITADDVDGSTMTDILTISAGTSAGATIKGGSAGDTIAVGDANADVVEGGAGADTITFDIEVSDVITGGAGADVFLMDNDTDTAAAGALIQDIAAEDDLDLDLSTIEVLTIDGGTAVTELTDAAGNDVVAGDLTVVSVTADNTALASGHIFMLSGKTYADSAAALADIQTSGARTFTVAANYADNDASLIAYELASGGMEIAGVQASATTATSDILDHIDVLVTLAGVTQSTFLTLDIDAVA